MIRRRHHFIPRFLLARFASRRSKKKSWILQIDANGASPEISTRDGAVSHGFYGADDSLEDAFGPIETELSARLRDIDAGIDPNAFGEDLRRLVWLLSIRTRVFRSQMNETWRDVMLHIFLSFRSPEARSAIEAHVASQYGEIVRDILKSLRWYQRMPISIFLRVPWVRRRLSNEVRRIIQSGEIDTMLEPLFAQLLQPGLVDENTSKAHVNVLLQMIKDGAVPPSFKPRSWRVLIVSDEPLVLGDCCTIALSADGRPGPLLGQIDSWAAVYVPISPERALVAYRGDWEMALTGSILNRASSSCASTFLFAAALPGNVSELLSLLGRNSAWLTTLQLKEMMSSIWLEQRSF